MGGLSSPGHMGGLSLSAAASPVALAMPSPVALPFSDVIVTVSQASQATQTLCEITPPFSEVNDSVIPISDVIVTVSQATQTTCELIQPISALNAMPAAANPSSVLNASVPHVPLTLSTPNVSQPIPSQCVPGVALDQSLLDLNAQYLELQALNHTLVLQISDMRAQLDQLQRANSSGKQAYLQLQLELQAVSSPSSLPCVSQATQCPDIMAGSVLADESPPYDVKHYNHLLAMLVVFHQQLHRLNVGTEDVPSLAAESQLYTVDHFLAVLVVFHQQLHGLNVGTDLAM